MRHSLQIGCFILKSLATNLFIAFPLNHIKERLDEKIINMLIVCSSEALWDHYIITF